MKFTGENMRLGDKKIESIDKVLTYIEQDIENPEKKEALEDLIDIHGWLTKVKLDRIKNSATEESKGPDLYIHAYMVVNSFKVVFGNWESNIHVVDGRVLLSNDLIYVDVNMDQGIVGCVVSFYHEASPVIVAESINTLKDIFGAGLKVSSECFTTDEATGGYVWGEEAIQQHLRNISGRKIRPIMFFDDNTIGNS